MKKLLLVLTILATAGSVFAAELKVTGDAMVRGTYLSNTAFAATNPQETMYYDYDFNVNAALVASEKATVFMKLTFDRNVAGSGQVAMGDGTYTAPTMTVPTGNAVLNLERAYINYKFAPFAQVNAGLMSGGQWATTFGNVESNVMRLQAIGALSADLIFIATMEKQLEAGPAAEDDLNKADFDQYMLSSIIKVAGLNIKPLVGYATKGATKLDGTYANMSGYQLTLGLDGDFGMVAFESEFDYKKSDKDGLDTDPLYSKTLGLFNDQKAYGAYLNVWVKVDPAKIGVAGAYGTGMKKDGTGQYYFGDDFDFAIVMDDFVNNANTSLPLRSGLGGWTVAKVYASATIGDLTPGAAFIYGKDNNKSAADVASKATFMEIDASLAYVLDAATTYTIAGGYVMGSDMGANAAYVPGRDETAFRVYHKLSVKF